MRIFERNKVLLEVNTGPGTIESDSFNLDRFLGMSITVKSTDNSAPAGITGSVWLASANTDEPGDFVTITGSLQQITGPGVLMWNVSQAFFSFIKVKFLITSGNAHLVVTATAKGEDGLAYDYHRGVEDI